MGSLWRRGRMIFVFWFLFKFVFFLESLRNVVIAQEARIKELQVAVKQLTDQKKKCDRHRKREGKFLESVITQCKGDNVPLTDLSCSKFCRGHKVKEAVCRALCATKLPPCAYWHQDTLRNYQRPDAWLICLLDTINLQFYIQYIFTNL